MATVRLLSVLLLVTVGQCSSDKDAKNTVNVVIIGAGISGLSAGRYLLRSAKHKFNVTVLEARGRIGGRVWTNKDAIPGLTGGDVDYGASWIHGSSVSNPIKQFALDHQIATKETNFEDVTVLWKEQPLNETTLNAAGATFKQMKNKVANSNFGNISFYAALEKLGYQQQLNDSVLNWFLAEYEADEGATARLVSSQDGGYRKMDGKDDVIPGGFAQVAESLCNGSAGEQALEVRLNETVQRIVVKNGSVTVQTTKGSYRADRVVVTLPLGVLKRGDVVFEPPLSPAKKDAVDKIGFGVLNKVFLKFNNVFWNKTKPFFALVEDDITQRGFLTFWINGYYVAGTPSLIGLLAGDSAVDAEAMTDDVVRGKAAAVLRRLFGSNATEPEVNFTMTRWNKDPYAFGAYSYHAVGSNASQRAALGASECPLHFAGEHTDTSYFATVHGAFLSGQRAAKEIEASPLSCKSSASATIIPALLILVLLTAHPF